MSLEVDVRLSLGAFRLDTAFSADGGVTALFGRSGSGKTTLVNVIAGLLAPDHGVVRVGGEPVVDTAAGLNIAMHRRRVGYVFQDARLFPHLDVRRNLLYGRWFNRGADLLSFDDAVGLLGIGDLLRRKPADLSGGEKQRVAIGRALLSNPRVLLMDEPLAALDGGRKAEILPYLERLRAETGIPILYVSHALDEVARLADTIVVLDEGKVAAVGPAEEVLSRVDLGPLTGRAEASTLLSVEVVDQDAAHGLTVAALGGQRLFLPAIEAAPGDRLRVRVRARDVALAKHRPKGLSFRNVLDGRIAEIGSEDGAYAEIAIDIGEARLRARVTQWAVDDLGLAVGDSVFALLKTVAFERRQIAPRQHS